MINNNIVHETCEIPWDHQSLLAGELRPSPNVRADVAAVGGVAGGAVPHRQRGRAAHHKHDGISHTRDAAVRGGGLERPVRSHRRCELEQIEVLEHEYGPMHVVSVAFHVSGTEFD